jgi:hypothetical protein
MGDRDGSPGDHDLELGRQRSPKLGLIDVSVDRVYGRAVRLQLFEHRGCGEIAGVDHRLGAGDQIDATVREAAAAPRHVGVGDDRDQLGSGF